ncbi:MAG: M3 family oligoendopeptidase [Acholeplasmataceae bacterium]
MITFKDLEYKRPDLEKEFSHIRQIIETFKNASNGEEAVKNVHQYYEAMEEIDAMFELAMVRYTLNTKDEFYQKEQTFFDEASPKIQEVSHEMNDAFLASPYRTSLIETFGALTFNKREQSKKTFSKDIMTLLTKENQLSTAYSKLTASAEIPFDGKTLNLSMMAPYMSSSDREIRHQAQLAVSQFFKDNEAQYDNMYDDMVQVRTEIAKTLGYETFTQLAYDRLGRLDYTEKEVAIYRKQIIDHVVPIAQQLYEAQRKRIGVDTLYSYDIPLTFKDGPAKPKGTEAELLQAADTMYAEMSPVTKDFFSFIRDRDLLDVTARQGKEGGGYCTLLPKFKLPFIFANFNGTAHDVDVLTHEAGHALQMYLSKDYIPDYRMPTMEAAEIHSMSMEFIAWPWMKLFFKEDTQKYYYQHLASAIKFLPYGALVDHFQHDVYNHPEMTPEQRKARYKELERKYLPHINYDDDVFLDRGTFWFKQGHIFQVPFYYIDYTLAQVVALEFWSKDRANHEQTFETYVSVCKTGGTKTFTDILTSHGLSNVFDPQAMKTIMDPVKTFLDGFDVTKL